MKNDLSDDSDNEYKGDLTMKSHDGRIVNIETLQVIEDLLKCQIWKQKKNVQCVVQN